MSLLLSASETAIFRIRIFPNAIKSSTVLDGFGYMSQISVAQAHSLYGNITQSSSAKR